jgi:hypothetical protein
MDNDKDQEDADRLQRALLEPEDDPPTWQSDLALVVLILLFVVLGYMMVEVIK